MRIGAFQFAVSGDVKSNFRRIRGAIAHAAQEGVDLLVFPECALTGYPPHDIPNSLAVSHDDVIHFQVELQELSNIYRIALIAGGITCDDGIPRNTAQIFIPEQSMRFYHKRALWGWDADNFAAGSDRGIFELGDWRIGVLICYEVRFPELFREFYRAKTDLNVVLFYDILEQDDPQRYELIKAHLMTRAAENITYTLSVNTCSACQTAPTAIFDRSGNTLCELQRHQENLLIWDLEKTALSFSESGRKRISDQFAKSSSE